MADVPTLDDVAARVGVSSRTVSRVLRNEGGYSPATERRVRDAVEELRYFPNLLARGLSGRPKGTIGMVGPNMTDPFFPELADEVQRTAHGRGLTTFYTSTFCDPAQQRRVLGALRSYGVDAVIIHPVAGTRDDLTRFAASGTPIVAIDREWSAPGLASVAADIEHGARLAVDSFVAAGRRRIAMIDGRGSTDDAQPPVTPRRTGFLDALPSDQAPLIEVATLEIDSGVAAMRRLLDRAPELDAVFASNDLLALGALSALAAAGRSVPGDVAVIGYDDIFAARVARPALSTIRYDRATVATEAVDAVQHFAEDRAAHLDPVRVGVELVERAST